jgi:RHS repeat-associated protein
MANFQTYNFSRAGVVKPPRYAHVPVLQYPWRFVDYDLTENCVKRHPFLTFSYISNVDLIYIYVKRQHETEEYEENQYFYYPHHLGNVRITFSDLKEPVTCSDLSQGWYATASTINNYYSFGMPMPDRNSNLDAYRFGFQGQEMDNEIYGDGGLIAFDERGYDSRLARWISIDPLFAKHPYCSPYVFVANNPILNKEIDGRDYAVYVDHDTKTIIIKATYYTQKGDADAHNSAIYATEFWNEQSGKYQYKVGKGKDAVYYDIIYQLDVLEVDDPERQVVADKRPIGISVEGEEKLITDGTSNSYLLKPDDDPSFKKENELGNTIGGALVSVKKSAKDADTGAHEDGHTLGFFHMPGTIMSEAENVNHQRRINTTIVGVALQKVGLGRIIYNEGFYNSDCNGTLQPAKGDAPEEFNNGKVIKKKL